jgi:3-oxoadipate enol-lactonase
MFKTSDGCPIAYTIHSAPNRPRLVLIHSLALDASVWDGVVSRLAGRAEVLTYDCRGHGRSGREARTFTTDLFARDLAELLDHVGWPKALIAGCSMGGCIAQAFAGHYGPRTAALGLIDTTAWYGEDAPKTWRDRAVAAQSKGLSGMVDFQVTRWFGDAFRAAHPEVVQTITRVFLANDLDCYAASCMLLGEADLRSFLATFQIPVEIIVGEEDYATPIPMARQLNEAIKGSKLTILPKARHLTPMECPDQIASHLLDLTQSAMSRHG